MATPPTDPAMADPMFRELRQRHPEVDIVLLPQQAPAPESRVPSLGPDDRELLAVEADAMVDELVERLAAEPDWPGVSRASRWHEDEFGQTWFECAVVAEPLPPGANVALLRVAGRAFLDQDWQARPVPGDRPRIAARRRGGFAATATVRPDALVLVVRTLRVRPTEGAATDTPAAGGDR